MSDPDPPNDTLVETNDDSDVVGPVTLPDIVDGRYRILARLGAGAMGVVLRAEDLFLQRPVAIKIVDPAPDRSGLQRFLKEAQALAQVRHENVVQVYAFGPLQTSSYLAMELVVGQPLEALIDAHAAKGEVIPLPRAIAILHAIGRGLEAVHARHLVHRDIKPGNIIIEQGTDRPVLIDFGLARRRSKSSPKISIVAGTPSYMAPEQARDPDGTRVTARTDLYALGCTAFELFTGRPVFEGTDIYTVLLAHLNEEPRRVSSLRPELAPIDDVIARSLAKDPADRHASVDAMLLALDAGFARVVMPNAAGPRALVVASESSLGRSIERGAVRTLRTHGQSLACDLASTVAEATALLLANTYDLLLLDEESAPAEVSQLLRLLRQRRPSAESIVLSRDLSRTTRELNDPGVRLVPKPVNVHVLAAVLGRLALLKTARA